MGFCCTNPCCERYEPQPTAADKTKKHAVYGGGKRGVHHCVSKNRDNLAPSFVRAVFRQRFSRRSANKSATHVGSICSGHPLYFRSTWTESLRAARIFLGGHLKVSCSRSHDKSIPPAAFVDRGGAVSICCHQGVRSLRKRGGKCLRGGCILQKFPAVAAVHHFACCSKRARARGGVPKRCMTAVI